MHDGDEGDDRRGGDQDDDDPLFEPIEDAVEHATTMFPFGSEPVDGRFASTSWDPWMPRLKRADDGRSILSYAREHALRTAAG